MNPEETREYLNPDEPYYYSLEEVDPHPAEEASDEEGGYDGPDTSGPNYAQAGNVPVQDADTPGGGTRKQPNCFLLLLDVLLNPLEGWKKIRRAGTQAEHMQQSCFYPLLAVLAASHFAALFYSPLTTAGEAAVGGVCAFTAFFSGYFLIVIAVKAILKNNFLDPAYENWVKVFVMFNLSSLAIFFTLIELLPMLWAVLIFLPLWTVYIACRGARFLRIPDNRQILVTALVCLLLVGVPSVADSILEDILPK